MHAAVSNIRRIDMYCRRCLHGRLTSAVIGEAGMGRALGAGIQRDSGLGGQTPASGQGEGRDDDWEREIFGSAWVSRREAGPQHVTIFGDETVRRGKKLGWLSTSSPMHLQCKFRWQCALVAVRGRGGWLARATRCQPPRFVRSDGAVWAKWVGRDKHRISWAPPVVEEEEEGEDEEEESGGRLRSGAVGMAEGSSCTALKWLPTLLTLP
ncbi:hypothetical protein IWX48DRAFT_143126 [Phyllosticta citricarpa]